MDLSYLRPEYFKPDLSILEFLNIAKEEKYIVIRFVSWEASHDMGHSGINYENKISLIEKLSKKYKVLISSEGPLPKELKKYQIKISPEQMHQVLHFASLFIGEGATMASECAMLGTPSIYVNTLEAGTCNEQEKKYKLLYNYKNIEGVLSKAFKILEINDKSLFLERRKNMLNDKIDVTKFMVWFLEEFPRSFELVKINPNYKDCNK